jgi:hypothetical protein
MSEIRILDRTRSELGLLKSRLEARHIKYIGEELSPIDHNDLLPLVDANLLYPRQFGFREQGSVIVASY